MLTQIMNHINNHFIHSYEAVELTISGTTVSGTFANTYIAGQYIYIYGSVINDGAYLISSVDTNELTLSESLTTETADCTLWGCKIDKGFLSLVTRITTWTTNNGLKAGITSEKVGNYSVSFGSGSGNSGMTWQSAFKNELNTYRKMKPSDFENYLRYHYVG